MSVSLISKMEKGYLQLLRVVVLLVASLAIFGAVFAGINALANYNAKPKEVSQTITIKPDDFSAKQDKAPATTSTLAKPSENSPFNKLVDDLAAVVDKHGKLVDHPTFAVSREWASNFVREVQSNERLGSDYIPGLVSYFDAVFSRKDVVQEAKATSYNDMAFKIFGQYQAEYLAQKAKISNAESEAENEALAKRASAAESLYLFGSLFAAFITMALLLVLIRIERNLRAISANGSLAPAVMTNAAADSSANA